MELILIVLVGVFMGAFNFAFFLFGYYLGTKREKEDGVTVTKENQDFIKGLMEWRNF